MVNPVHAITLDGSHAWAGHAPKHLQAYNAPMLQLAPPLNAASFVAGWQGV